EHTLERSDCNIHYWLGGLGDAPLLVFLHGATMDHRMFDEQVKAFAGEYRLLVWDARGHGASRPLSSGFVLEDCADDLIALLDHLNVKKVVLVGQSMGGYIAQQVYLKYPERVQAIVIIGAINIAFPYAKWEVWTVKATLPLFNIWPYGHFARTVAKSISLKPEVQAYALATINQLTRAEFLTIWKAVTLVISEQGYPRHHIEVPLLLTHGDHDTTGSIRKQAPKWAAYEPDVEYVVIPDAGHNANQDNAPFFNASLHKFLSARVTAG
ncbi:MAG: alpha/beta hydrolase, partial [Anaerolineae bacterium]|nr:alpha/beta hydrolase [Anaerolineae bacterium]